MKAGEAAGMAGSARIKADYFRQVNGQSVAFSGDPGSGTPIGGHPALVAALHSREPRGTWTKAEASGNISTETVATVQGVLSGLPPKVQIVLGAGFNVRVTVASRVSALYKNEAKSKGVFVYPPPPPNIVVGENVRDAQGKSRKLRPWEVKNTAAHEIGHAFARRTMMVEDQKFVRAFSAGQTRVKALGKWDANRSKINYYQGVGVDRPPPDHKQHETMAELFAHVVGHPSPASETLARLYPELVEHIRLAIR